MKQTPKRNVKLTFMCNFNVLGLLYKILNIMNTGAELGRGLCYSIFVQTTIKNIQWRWNPFNPLWVRLCSDT